MAADDDQDKKGGFWTTLWSVIFGSIHRFMEAAIVALAFELFVTLPASAGDLYLLLSHDGPKIINDFILEPENFLHALAFYVVVLVVLLNVAAIIRLTYKTVRFFLGLRPGTRKALLVFFAIALLIAAGTVGYYERDLLIQKLASIA